MHLTSLQSSRDLRDFNDRNPKIKCNLRLSRTRTSSRSWESLNQRNPDRRRRISLDITNNIGWARFEQQATSTAQCDAQFKLETKVFKIKDSFSNYLKVKKENVSIAIESETKAFANNSPSHEIAIEVDGFLNLVLGKSVGSVSPTMQQH
ncbi:CLUMA_CG011303, isoform A [Clunio marinus]|uniref:CLUMA_CG011303, isoform A n=1 Tax=Clunio marinus TaxID=568069 RepID=A0A1J1IDT9_9DIPT|nr:CLUMA_CG011303, isoform A [Clunio marinus]